MSKILSKILVGEGAQAREIAILSRKPDDTKAGPGIIWLGGFRSDMEGSKAVALDQFAKDKGVACTRFDYSGHGQSGGAFIDGTISRWLEESLAVFKTQTNGSQILVGSSMGGWIALRMVEELKKSSEGDKVHGLVLLAPAPDFTKDLHEPKLTDQQRKGLDQKGYFEEPTPYGPDPNIFTKKLFDDGARNLVMTKLIETNAPVHIIQGMADPDVPWQHAMKLIEYLPQENVTLTLIRDGDHRLSREQDIAKILDIVGSLYAGFPN